MNRRGEHNKRQPVQIVVLTSLLNFFLNVISQGHNLMSGNLLCRWACKLMTNRFRADSRLIVAAIFTYEFRLRCTDVISLG